MSHLDRWRRLLGVVIALVLAVDVVVVVTSDESGSALLTDGVAADLDPPADVGVRRWWLQWDRDRPQEAGTSSSAVPSTTTSASARSTVSGNSSPSSALPPSTGAGTTATTTTTSSANLEPPPEPCPDMAPLAASAPDKPGLYVANEDGSHLRRLDVGSSGSISPDGGSVAFTYFDVCIGPVAGGPSLKVELPGAPMEISRGRVAQWSPDGTRIAVLVSHSQWSFFPTDVYVADVATGRTTLVYPTAKGHYTAADWSPDGSRLAIADGASIQIVRADGSGARRIYRDDDERLFTVEWPTEGEILTTDSAQNLIRVASDGSGATESGHRAGSFDVGPDGRIAISIETEWQHWDVSVLEPTGSSRVVSSRSGLSPWWLGNGRVLYLSYGEGQSSSLISVAADGGGERVLFSLPPVWGSGPVMGTIAAVPNAELLTFAVGEVQSISGSG